jgi:hypothetical protein
MRDIGAADAIGQRVRVPILRILVGRGGVDDDIRPEIADQRIDDRLVGNAVFDEPQSGMRLQIVAPASREIIDRKNLIAAGEQQVDQRRTDEARPAGHKNLHYTWLSTVFLSVRSRFVARLIPRPR